MALNGELYDDLPKAFRIESIENIKNSGNIREEQKQKIYNDDGPKNAELLILPDGNIETRLRFLFGVYTNEKDQSSVTQEFNTDKAVTISSTLTANKPGSINAGFYYGTDVNNLSENVEASFKRNIDNQGKGNCEFVVTLSNLEPGKTYYYRAYTYDGLNYNYGEPCSFEIKESGGEIVAYTSCPDSHHPHLIDLGLPSGTKWACCNLGASKPESYGRYYAWGETTGKSSYTDSNYLDGKGTSYDIGKDIAGTRYDAATVNWGSPWVMPSKGQMNELEDECTSEWTTKNGVNGCKFTGPNGASIFLPAGGGYFGDDLSSAGSIGVYWSSSLNESQTGKAWYLYFNSGSEDTFYSLRSCGLSVRPVKSDAAPEYPDLQLSETQISIVKSSSATVEIIAGSGVYGVTNLNSSVAKATLQGTTITINAVAEGDAKVVATDMQTGLQVIITVTVTASGDSPDVSPGEAIDLGLPSGTKWASCNVGATKPEEYGGYYAWGETEEKDKYNWSNYKWSEGDYFPLTKYITKSEYGTVDNKKVLDPEDDVAQVKWGGDWRMPTKDDLKELFDNTTNEWTTLNGVNGLKFTSKTNGNVIFLPAAGYCTSSRNPNYRGTLGWYWSSSLDDPSKSEPIYAWQLSFTSDNAYYNIWTRFNDYGRSIGYSVRPVLKK